MPIKEERSYGEVQFPLHMPPSQSRTKSHSFCHQQSKLTVPMTAHTVRIHYLYTGETSPEVTILQSKQPTSQWYRLCLFVHCDGTCWLLTFPQEGKSREDHWDLTWAFSHFVAKFVYAILSIYKWSLVLWRYCCIQVGQGQLKKLHLQGHGETISYTKRILSRAPVFESPTLLSERLTPRIISNYK